MLLKTVIRRAPFLWLALSIALNAQGQAPLAANDLVQLSNSASDLTKLGSYTLKAVVAVLGPHKATGTLTLLHDGNNWREQLDFSDFHEVNVTRGQKYATWRKPDLMLTLPETLDDLSALWKITLPEGAQPGPVERSQVHGSPALCFELDPEKGAENRYCFDPETHLLMSTEQKSRWSRKETRFLDYQQVDGVRFPYMIQFLQPDTVEMDEQRISVVKMPLDAAAFAFPPGAREFQTCVNPKPLQVVHRVNPVYPMRAKVAHITGDVRFLVTIGVDGKVHDIHAISGYPVLAQAAVEAVRQWEYTPETCPTGPVAMETTIKITFRMEP